MTVSETRASAAMRRALALAASPGVPLGPNPRVGCVLLDAAGRTVAEGFHRGAGNPHAEVDALTRAGEAARGTTAVVTLEPCNHTGRTGPCAQALIAAGVRRVVVAQRDTNPVAVGGAESLRAAGIEVETGLLADEARATEPGVDLRRRAPPPVRHLEVRHHPRRPQRGGRRHQPLGLQPGRSARHPPAPRAVRHDAGRHQHGRRRRPAPHRRATRPACRLSAQPLRAVMGERDLDPGRRVFDDAAETVHLRTRDPEAALKDLFARDRQHVFLEGGPTLAAAFLGGRPRRRGRRLRRADAAGRGTSRRSATWESPRSPRRCTCRSPT